eukprot:PLAT6674.3.p2 GENE.PLAT6674.3~~PLAT6674.3.p2  ORF type:complete len:392 (+),score=133.68 PLAT6674.3:1354-2529(+)
MPRGSVGVEASVIAVEPPVEPAAEGKEEVDAVEKCDPLPSDIAWAPKLLALLPCSAMARRFRVAYLFVSLVSLLLTQPVALVTNHLIEGSLQWYYYVSCVAISAISVMMLRDWRSGETAQLLQSLWSDLSASARAAALRNCRRGKWLAATIACLGTMILAGSFILALARIRARHVLATIGMLSSSLLFLAVFSLHAVTCLLMRKQVQALSAAVRARSVGEAELLDRVDSLQFRAVQLSRTVASMATVALCVICLLVLSISIELLFVDLLFSDLFQLAAGGVLFLASVIYLLLMSSSIAHAAQQMKKQVDSWFLQLLLTKAGERDGVGAPPADGKPLPMLSEQGHAGLMASRLHISMGGVAITPALCGRAAYVTASIAFIAMRLVVQLREQQ